MNKRITTVLEFFNKLFQLGKPLLKKTHLDHRKPKSKNGSNEITNCDILNPVTNQAKSDMSSKEFIDFCISVVEFNGFKVTPQI